MAINLNATPAELIKIINNTTNSGDIIAAVKHIKADESVLSVAVDRIYYKTDNGSTIQNDCYNAVISSRKVTPNILIKIINEAGVSGSVIINAINSSVANEAVLSVAVDRIYHRTDNGSTIQNDCYNAVISNGKVTPNILIKIINEDGVSGSVIINAINSSVANEAVLSVAVDRIYHRTDNGSTIQNDCYNAVISSGKVTSNILIKIINEGGVSASVIVNAVNSPKANDVIYNKAIEIATRRFDSGSKAQNDILNAAVTRRTSANNATPNTQTSSTAQDQNGNAQSTSSQNSESSAQQNGENNTTDQDVVVEPETITYNVETEDSVTDRLRRNVEDGMSTMLWGLSGIGKTSRVREIDPTFTMIKLKNDMLPEEVTGGKEPNGKPGEMYPPKWYVKLCEKCKAEPDRMHILFIDEITNVKNNVKSLVWDIIEDRRVNGDEDWELPDNCAIVAAGNRPEESTSVITDYNGGVLPEPLHDRFDFHIEIPLDMKEWQQWALETNPKTGNLNIHPSVLSFCVANADSVMFSSLDMNDVTQPRLSPRRWAKLSKAIYMAEKRGGKACHVSNQRITECIGTALADAFIAHYEKQPLDMKMVEKGQYEPTDFNNIDDKLFALSSLIAEYKGSEMAVIDFIETCLGDDYVAVYNVMKKQHTETLSNVVKSKTLTSETIKK